LLLSANGMKKLRNLKVFAISEIYLRCIIGNC